MIETTLIEIRTSLVVVDAQSQFFKGVGKLAGPPSSSPHDSRDTAASESPTEFALAIPWPEAAGEALFLARHGNMSDTYVSDQKFFAVTFTIREGQLQEYRSPNDAVQAILASPEEEGIPMSLKYLFLEGKQAIETTFDLVKGEPKSFSSGTFEYFLRWRHDSFTSAKGEAVFFSSRSDCENRYRTEGLRLFAMLTIANPTSKETIAEMNRKLGGCFEATKISAMPVTANGVAAFGFGVGALGGQPGFGPH